MSKFQTLIKTVLACKIQGITPFTLVVTYDSNTVVLDDAELVILLVASNDKPSILSIVYLDNQEI